MEQPAVFSQFGKLTATGKVKVSFFRSLLEKRYEEASSALVIPIKRLVSIQEFDTDDSQTPPTRPSQNNHSETGRVIVRGVSSVTSGERNNDGLTVISTTGLFEHASTAYKREGPMYPGRYSPERNLVVYSDAELTFEAVDFARTALVSITINLKK